MLSRSKLYTKKDPDRDARLFLIFAEGVKRERLYFNYFSQISSQIRIEVAPIVGGRNDPGGLFDTAIALIFPTEATQPKYELRAGDEVWFVIDTDQWGPAITELRANVAERPGWNIAQSNPCFEVWLYYHFRDVVPNLVDMASAEEWKQIVHEVCGGFNSHKHPIFIQTAIDNSRTNFTGAPGNPGLPSTEMHFLADRMLPLVKETLDAALQAMGL